MKRSLSELILKLARGARPSAAVASGLLAPLAMGAPGDLDPGFANVGRLASVIDLNGRIWSIDPVDGAGTIVAGGDFDFRGYYCWYYDCDFSGSNFVGELTEDGALNPAYTPARPADIEVRDVARQSDGKIVAVGRRVLDFGRSYRSRMVVYRLDSAGPMDTDFAVDGVFELPLDANGSLTIANAVVLEPDGRIVVSGSRGDQLIVLRLLADGTLDGSFGDAGVFTGPAHDYDSGAHLVRTSVGGYRVTTTSEAQCRVIGLTAAGAIDGSFGSAGIASVAAAAGDANACHALKSRADGRLLVAGNAGGLGFAASLLASGAPDPSFVAGAVASTMTDATAIETDDDGKVLVAGNGDEGARIVRLLAGGGLDSSFGNAGSTLIDLESEHGAYSVVLDLSVRPDGGLLAAGGDYWSDAPFVVRLLGDGSAGGPGVLSLVQTYVEGPEGGNVVVNVRRSGGASGDVSVAYESIFGAGALATGGEDYEEVSGRLTWADGDASTREIIVPIHADAGTTEEFEEFRISLSDAQGGAGMGTRNATASIAADGAPAGQFAIYDYGEVIGENGPYQIWIYRNFYSEGAVSVTLTPVAGTATAGADIGTAAVTVSWADQDTEAKLVEIPIINDSDQESSEVFTVELSNPTGGAVIGPHAAVTVQIAPNDSPIPRPPPPPNRSGGGGSTGLLSLLFLGLAEIFRAMQRRVRILR